MAEFRTPKILHDFVYDLLRRIQTLEARQQEIHGSWKRRRKASHYRDIINLRELLPTIEEKIETIVKESIVGVGFKNWWICPSGLNSELRNISTSNQTLRFSGLVDQNHEALPTVIKNIVVQPIVEGDKLVTVVSYSTSAVVIRASKAGARPASASLLILQYTSATDVTTPIRFGG